MLIRTFITSLLSASVLLATLASAADLEPLRVAISDAVIANLQNTADTYLAEGFWRGQ